MINKFFLLGIGGVTVAGTGAGVGIYYGTRDNVKTKSPVEPGTDGPVASPKPEAPKTRDRNTFRTEGDAGSA